MDDRVQALVAPRQRARLLSFDGGGIRGLFALQVAKRIETLLRAREARPDLVLADYFHYIGGTSTGAIIAAALSWGLSVDEVIRLYRDHGRLMFTRASRTLAGLRGYRFAREPISEFLRGFFVEADGRPATLGSSRLRTLLLIVARNASTGSPWPLSNNPLGKYNDRTRPGCNLDLPLWQLVRASTAAPTFFPPEIIKIVDQATGVAAPRIFAFEDGGVTPFNNPAYLLYTMATLPEYGLRWPSGRERMSLVSVGTGTLATGRGDRLEENLLGLVRGVPAGLIGSSQWWQDLLCRQRGECRHGEALDSELGDMVRPNPEADFLYTRYDRRMTGDDSRAAARVSKRGLALDNVDLMDFLCELGAAYAESAVSLDHFD